MYSKSRARQRFTVIENKNASISGIEQCNVKTRLRHKRALLLCDVTTVWVRTFEKHQYSVDLEV